ncbi:hypothetical protein CP973_33715 [Streptomyces albofaciens JCM 4342]|uniref:hypothetical protein n=1 Tax=Streptomyces albofaciens TaxID=66866 RepID=UPI000A961AE4|nr:hypothetical protein [Streptomyces albofaciens]KAA6214099.1 hypothetical protein CP973_33715 [Streptomyces albofaciens JCM 4342]
MTDHIEITQDIGPWRVLLCWAADADPASGPTRVLITPRPDADPADTQGGVASTVLRQIDFKKAGEQFRSVRPTSTEREIGQDPEGEGLRWLLNSEGVSDAYLAFLAESYVRAVSQAVPNVTAHLAALAHKRPETIRGHLKEARKRDLLTTVPGKAGGRLTPKAAEIVTGDYLDKVTDYLMNQESN